MRAAVLHSRISILPLARVAVVDNEPAWALHILRSRSAPVLTFLPDSRLAASHTAWWAIVALVIGPLTCSKTSQFMSQCVCGNTVTGIKNQHEIFTGPRKQCKQQPHQLSHCGDLRSP